MLSRKLFFTLGLLFLLPGCVETVVVGTVATGAAVMSDGSIFDLSQDARIRRAVRKSFKTDGDADNYKTIDINVFNSDIMLSGYVRDSHYKSLAVQKAKSVKPDVNIIDEIVVFGPDYKVSSVSDAFISKQITMKLKAAKGVKSGNYEYNVSDSIVYIIGIAQDQQEFKKVIEIASTVKGVKKVISYIMLNKNN